MLLIINSVRLTSTSLQSLAMFVGALCHDLDHRGFNNKFMIDIGSPLAAIYSTSTMENHHFNMAIIILQQVRWLHGSSMSEMITQWLR